MTPLPSRCGKTKADGLRLDGRHGAVLHCHEEQTHGGDDARPRLARRSTVDHLGHLSLLLLIGSSDGKRPSHWPPMTRSPAPEHLSATGSLSSGSSATCPPIRTTVHVKPLDASLQPPRHPDTPDHRPQSTIRRQTASWNCSTGPSRPLSELGSPQQPGWMSSHGCSLASGR